MKTSTRAAHSPCSIAPAAPASCMSPLAPADRPQTIQPRTRPSCQQRYPPARVSHVCFGFIFFSFCLQVEADYQTLNFLSVFMKITLVKPFKINVNTELAE